FRGADSLRVTNDGGPDTEAANPPHGPIAFRVETMLILRSLLFNVAFYANMTLWIVLLLPALALPRGVFLYGARLWAWSSLWLMRVIVGTRVEIRGLERIPRGGLLVAAKHQSLWETFTLLTLFEDP